MVITYYDPLQRYGETDVVVPANPYISRSARDMRIAVLEDFERGDRNLLPNPSFETDTAGWNTMSTAGTLTRVVGDAAPGGGSACLEFVAAGANNRAAGYPRMAPGTFAAVPYRFSVYLRQTAGSGDWRLCLGNDAASLFVSKDIFVDSTWRRFSITYSPASAQGANSSAALRGWVEAVGAGTIRLDAAMVTRGSLLFDYSDGGTSGRWPNFCGNGSFDGGALNGWYDAWANRCTNGSFETNTTGWAVTADAFHTAATSITRSTVQAAIGAASGLVDVTASGQGAHFALSGTFVSGRTYDIQLRVRMASVASSNVTVGIGSQGTPADKAEATSAGTDTAWQTRTVAWTPSADRTDAHLYVKIAANIDFYIDGAQVTRRDTAAASGPAYSDSGPGGGGSFVTTASLSQLARWGSKSHQIDTPATAGAGRIYDFAHYGPYFVAGRPYTLSVWLRATASCPYKVGLGANKGDGTWDEASTTGTLSADTWTEVTVTWTPSADRSSLTAFDIVLFIQQTDATAHTIYIDGVRVIPESSADDFEMDHWILASEPDVYLTSASLSGTAQAALTQLNALTLSRHYIRPTMASPFYEYVTASRDDLPSKASAETFDDDLVDFGEADIDRASIVNVVPVGYALDVEYYSDQTSIDKYSPRPASQVNGASFFPDIAIPDSIGPALLARYRDPRARPAMNVVNRWPSQLQRELADLVTVNFQRLRISGGRYLILRLETTVSEAGQRWETAYALEEHAF